MRKSSEGTSEVFLQSEATKITVFIHTPAQNQSRNQCLCLFFSMNANSGPFTSGKKTSKKQILNYNKSNNNDNNNNKYSVKTEVNIHDETFAS